MRRLLLTLLALICVACNSGGGSSSTSSSSVAAGTYRGTANLTVSGGGASASQSAPVSLVVNPDQTVTIGSFPGSAPISGNAFVHTVPASTLNGSGLTCPQGNLLIDGKFAGGAVSGGVSSTGVVCNGLGVTLSGDYAATLQTQALRGGYSADLREELRRALTRSVGAQ